MVLDWTLELVEVFCQSTHENAHTYMSAWLREALGAAVCYLRASKQLTRQYASACATIAALTGCLAAARPELGYAILRISPGSEIPGVLKPEKLQPLPRQLLHLQKV